MLQALHRSRLRLLLVALLILTSICAFVPPADAQVQFPYLTAGRNSSLVQADLAEMNLPQQIWGSLNPAKRLGADPGLIDSGAVSALDLQAPEKAIQQLKQAYSLLKGQNLKDAIKCLQRAITIYPDFVSAHNVLGLAYLEKQDPRAKEEFEIAAQLDDKFPGPFLNLGMLALSSNDFSTAAGNFQKAAFLSPNDPHILAVLAFAQNGDQKYQDVLRTVAHIHACNHRGVAAAHYIAAAAAMSLRDLTTVRSQLDTLLQEDPANPLSPLARKNLVALDHPIPDTSAAATPVSIQEDSSTLTADILTFPNSDRLKAELNSATDDSDSDICINCAAPEFASVPYTGAVPSALSTGNWSGLYTIRRPVDETALFFAVSEHGRSVVNLSLPDVQIRDDNRAPEKILQFIPQSQLPLRVGLLIDTSDSVGRRFNFEKTAAVHFLTRILSGPSDLAFVAGFNTDVAVTQDFTSDLAALSRGIAVLSTGEGNGTSLFDAVHLACWKLAAYPDEGRVARVLLVLTDGEDNSSHRSLRQSVEEAELSGITVYTVDTSQRGDPMLVTDAEKVLRTMADRTGGEFLYPGDLRVLDHHLSKLPDAIRSRYLVAYRAANFLPNGKFRSIHISAQKDGKILQVHVRKGYYARLEPPAR